jgi:hypothetical protein
LVELLVVMVALSLLLTMSGPLLRMAVGARRPPAVAAQIGAALDRARVHAIGKSVPVWVRIGPQSKDVIRGAEDATALAVSIGEWRQTLNGTGEWRQLGRPETYPNYTLAKLAAYGDRPDAASGTLDGTVWLRFEPSGEVRGIQDQAVKEPPPTAPQLFQWLELGLQPTERGAVPERLKSDTAVVQVAGLTGQIVRYEP